VGANIGGIDVAHRVSRDTGRRSARSHGTEVGRIRYESEQQSVDGTTDDDAAQFTRLRSRRSVSSGRLVAERGADIKLVIRADEDRAWLPELLPSGDETAVLVENLDTTVEAIGNVDATERTTNEDIVWVIEIAGLRSFVSPGLDEAAILGEFDDAGIIRCIAGMAIGNKNIAICRKIPTPVGRSKVSVPLPPTPILPSTINSLPFWSSLRTSCPRTRPPALRAGISSTVWRSLTSLAHRLPSLSTVNP
jgi:hypothetical protein